MKLQCKVCESHDLIVKDNTIICENCGCKYSIDEAKKILSDNNISAISKQTQNIHNNYKSISQTQKNTTLTHNKIFQIISNILMISVLIITFTIAIVHIIPFEEITKQKPSVTAQQTLTGIDFYIECKDNYSYVELEVRLLDNNDNIIDVVTLTGSNYKKGNTYTLSYYYEDLSSLINALKSNRVTYKITKYE